MEIDNKPQQANTDTTNNTNKSAPAPGPNPGPVPAPQQTQQQPPQQKNDKTDVLGIISLVMIIIFPLVGAILGFIGISKAKKEGYKNTLSLVGAIVNSILVVLGTIFILFVFATANEIADEINETAQENAALIESADRADTQATDVEVAVGEAANIRGLSMTVTSIRTASTLGEYNEAESGKTYVVANVAIRNESNETQNFSPYDFRVQTAAGQVLDSTYVFGGAEPELDTADLVAGGSTEGNVVFEVPVESDSQYIIWKPGFESDRAIVEYQQ